MADGYVVNRATLAALTEIARVANTASGALKELGLDEAGEEMSRNIEFLMIGEKASKDSRSSFSIAGRCLRGPIFPGDAFSSVGQGENRETVQLTVEKILAYGKVLTQLDPVVTAQLTLSGNLPGTLADHSILSGESEG